MRKATEQAGQAFIEMLCPYTTQLVLPHLFSCFDGRRNWQVWDCADSNCALTHQSFHCPSTALPGIMTCRFGSAVPGVHSNADQSRRAADAGPAGKGRARTAGGRAARHRAGAVRLPV